MELILDTYMEKEKFYGVTIKLGYIRINWEDLFKQIAGPHSESTLSSRYEIRPENLH